MNTLIKYVGLLSIVLCGCKAKKQLSAAEYIEKGDRFYTKRKYGKALDMYLLAYPDVQNSHKLLHVKERMSYCYLIDKEYAKCVPLYKQLYDEFHDSNKTRNGYYMCYAMFKILPSNIKRDISQYDEILNAIDDVLDSAKDDDWKEKLKELQKIITVNIGKKYIDIISFYDKMGYNGSAVVYSNIFFSNRYNEDSKDCKQIHLLRLKNQYYICLHHEQKQQEYDSVFINDLRQLIRFCKEYLSKYGDDENYKFYNEYMQQKIQSL